MSGDTGTTAPDPLSSTPQPRAGGWPPVGYEARDWQPSLMAGRLVDIVAGSYAAAVPPTIATVTPYLDRDLLKMCREASFEIARFDSELGPPGGPRRHSPIVLRRVPIPSMSISTVTPCRNGMAPVDVPQAITSPGDRVMSREIRLTSWRGEKIMSLTG